MRKTYRLLSLLTIPFFALRLIDALTNIDPATGFFISGNWLKHIVIVAVLVAAVVYITVLSKKSASDFCCPSAGTPPCLFFGASALAVAAGSVLLFTGVFKNFTLKQIFMSKMQLYDIGISNTHFRIEFWCSLLGIIAAAWFIFAAVQFFSGNGDVSKHPFFCCVPFVWFTVRALSDFVVSPVNPNNTVIFACLASNLILALFYLRYTRFASMGYPKEDAQKLAPLALLAFVFTLSFKLPLIFVTIKYSPADTVLIFADTFAAAAAFCITDLVLRGDVPNEKEMV